MENLIGRNVHIKYSNGTGRGIISNGTLNGHPFNVLDESGEVVTWLSPEEAESLSTKEGLPDMTLN
jgi:hypothetical protein